MSKRFIVPLSALILIAPVLTAAATWTAGTEPTDLPPGREVQVRIDRDAFGVPHVYADTLYSLFWGNGYVQAQDRLFQLDVLRHVGKGESAAYLGPSQLAMDMVTRRELYTDEERTQRWENLPAADREAFQGYADGVNAWIAKTRADPSLLSSEFYAIGHPPADWVPEDTIAIAEYLLDIFGAGSGGNELENAKLLLRLKELLGEDAAEAAFNDFFPMHDPDTYTTIPADEYVYPATEGPLAFADVPDLQWELVEAAAGAEPVGGAMSLPDAATAFGLRFGSNALVVAPHLTEGGNAALIGGPQMAYFNPMVPYEVGLHGAGYDAVGMGVGGAPGVIIGRTEHYAWTVTSGSSDQVDVVAHKLVDGEPRTYYVSGTSGETRGMDCRIETHYGPPTAIDPNPPVLAVQEVCRTERGPVFAINEEAGYAFVRERTHRLDELRSGILWLTLSTAADLEGFQDHMETFCFEFNFHVADDSGNIAYLHFGCQPVRAEGYDPRLPRLAGAWDWVDVRSGRELPHVVNPDKGYIVNWNNKPALGWSGGDAMEKWGPVHRAELLENTVQKFLADDGKLSTQDLKDLNVEISTRSPFPPNTVPFILDATAGSNSTLVEDARAALVDFAAPGYGWDDADGDGRYDHPGFAIYETWRGLVQDAVFRDELGGHVREMGFRPAGSSDPHAADHGREDTKDNVLVRALDGTSGHDWCDRLSSPGVETCADVVRSTFAEAVNRLAHEYGTTDVEKWRQSVHQIRFVGLSGGPAWEIPMVNRPSFHHYYDFGTGEAGSILPPGTYQSWKPADFVPWSAQGSPRDAMPHPHMRDQLDLYVDWEYKPAYVTPPTMASSETHVVSSVVRRLAPSRFVYAPDRRSAAHGRADASTARHAL